MNNIVLTYVKGIRVNVFLSIKTMLHFVMQTVLDFDSNSFNTEDEGMYN